MAVVEPSEARRDKAAEIGADSTVRPDDAAEHLRQLTNGLGADVVYECAGIGATVQGSVDLVRRGGTVGLVGVAVEVATIMPALWVVKEVTAIASLAYTHGEFVEAADLIETGRVRVEPLHDHTVGLSGLGEALGGLADKSLDAVKVLVDPAL